MKHWSSRKVEIYKAYIKLLRTKKKRGVPSIKELTNIGINRNALQHHFGGLIELEREALKNKPDLFSLGHVPGDRKDRRAEVLELYQQERKKNNNQPLTISKLNSSRIVSHSMVKTHFGSISEIELALREERPELFDNVTLDSFYTKKEIRKTRAAFKNAKTVFVTSVVTGCDVDLEALKAVKTFCKKRNATLAVVVCEDPAMDKTHGKKLLVDKVISQDPDIFLVTEDTFLNSNLLISNIELQAKQIDPATGLEELASRSGSCIFASPKQRLRPIPVGGDKYAHLIMTPGAITKPKYNSQMYKSKRTAKMAEYSHIMGGLVCEIKNNQVFFVRQVQFDETGSFIDLGFQYQANGKVANIKALSITPGDWHTGETCPVTRDGVKAMCDMLSPEYLILHDYFNGISVNRHEIKNIVKRTQAVESGISSLDEELEGLAKESEELLGWNIGKIIVTYGNHDDFLRRFISFENFRDHPQNFRTLCKLVEPTLDDENPVKWAHDNMFDFPKELRERMIWLEDDEDYFMAGINHGHHGHHGPMGSYSPSTKVIAKCYGNSNVAHTHYPEIYGGCYRAGTSTFRKLSYMTGPSQSLNSQIVTYPNGARQLTIMIKGEFTTMK